MPITSVEKDLDALTMTVTADFPVPVSRLWDAYADPRQLEKFWGPEGWPATFTRHDMAPGGRSEYYMTGPDGERADAGRTYRAPTRPWRKPDLDQPWHGESTSRARQPGYAVGLLHRAGDYHHADADADPQGHHVGVVGMVGQRGHATAHVELPPVRICGLRERRGGRGHGERDERAAHAPGVGTTGLHHDGTPNA